MSQWKKATAQGGYSSLPDGDARVLPTFGAKMNFVSSVFCPNAMLPTMMNKQMQLEERRPSNANLPPHKKPVQLSNGLFGH